MDNTLGGTSSGKPEVRCLHCGQTLPGSDQWKKQRFTWGILLGLVTTLPFVVGLLNAFRSISAARTTGLGAVAGGFSETYTMMGIAAMIIFAAGGIVFLLRGFTAKRTLRMIVSAIGIAWCGLILAATCLSLLLIAFLRRQ
jgi:succinate dehydrogenase hydrophobic anchor subunit